MKKDTSKAYRKLKALRIEYGYTQDRFAAKVGMSENSYILKENGKRAFTLPEAERIARFFDKDIKEVFC